MADAKQYLSKKNTAVRYDVTTRSIDRWERTYDIGFPAAVVINGRRFYGVEDLQRWERSRAATTVAA